MGHQQLAPMTPALWFEAEPSLPFITHCNRAALNHLGRAFLEYRPLSVLVGEGRFGATHIIHRFSDAMGKDVDFIRIDARCTDALSCMRALVSALKFETKDLSVSDLENIFRMFLSFQRKHRRRTIVCVEEAQDTSRWVLDKIRKLVEWETDGKYGLMVILAGRRQLDGLLREPPLDAISSRDAQRITVAPFSLAETRQYIQRRIKSEGNGDITRIFDFKAINLIHDMCGGVPDAVSGLCCKSLQIADEEGTAPVTTDLVKRAAAWFEVRSLAPTSRSAKKLAGDNGVGAGRIRTCENRCS